MPLSSSSEEEEEDLVRAGLCLPYTRYPKIILPIDDTNFWFLGRYVASINDVDNQLILLISDNSDKCSQRNIELIYDQDYYIVAHDYLKTCDEIEELLNELKKEIDRVNGLMSQLYEGQRINICI